MRGWKRKLNKLLLLLLCCGLLCCPVFAEENLCSLRVTLSDEEKQPVSDINVEICQITAFDGSSHTLTQAFSTLPLSAEALAGGLTPAQAEEVYQYAVAHEAETTLHVTNSRGAADFAALQQGIYLVFERGNQMISFQPYLVMLPSYANGNAYYSLYSEPKVVSADSRSIMVKIEWIDNDNAAGKRPESVDVVLTRDVSSLSAQEESAGTPYRRVTLTPRCDWEHTFHMLPLSGVYGVIESPVAEYEYLGCEEVYEGFILTYRYQQGSSPTPTPTPIPPPDDGEKLPQTGFRLWPVYGMLMGGVALVVWGMAELCINKEDE